MKYLKLKAEPYPLAVIKGVPARAWRFANNQPVKKSAGGYWLRSGS